MYQYIILKEMFNMYNRLFYWYVTNKNFFIFSFKNYIILIKFWWEQQFFNEKMKVFVSHISS